VLIFKVVSSFQVFHAPFVSTSQFSWTCYMSLSSISCLFSLPLQCQVNDYSLFNPISLVIPYKCNHIPAWTCLNMCLFDRFLYNTLRPSNWFQQISYGCRANGDYNTFIFLCLANLNIRHSFNSSINNISMEAVKTCKFGATVVSFNIESKVSSASKELTRFR
jgi:hypothetical protein